MKKRAALIICVLLLLPLPSAAFNENYIISDEELVDYNSMTVQDIENFLFGHGSFLAYYADFYPEDNVFMTAADIIWRTAQKFYLNPKLILTLLEKEQSLMTVQKPAMRRLDWAMGYAVCDKCRLSHPLVSQFRGFGKQVYHAANKIRNSYLSDIEKKGVTQSGFGPGITKKINRSTKIMPANKATAALYTYTPHIKGNKSLYIIWKKWFSNIQYPDGSLLQDIKTGGVYLIEDGKKRPFASKGALTSWYNPEWIVQTTSDHLNKYPTGETIVVASAHSKGILLQHELTGGVYWVLNGTKHPIPDKSILKIRFPKTAITRASVNTFDDLEKGAPVKFTDGTLVKNRDNSSTYFISKDKLRPIHSEDVFLAYNWKWENVIAAPKEILALYEIGVPITLLNEETTPSVGEEADNNNGDAQEVDDSEQDGSLTN